MSFLNIILTAIGVLSAAVFYNELVAHPLIALRALARFYWLPSERRQSTVLRAVSKEWWRMALVPVYVLTALLLIGYLGAGQ